jgi:hypothetical protein
MRVLRVKSVCRNVAEYGQVQVTMQLCALHNQQWEKLCAEGIHRLVCLGCLPHWL